METLRFNRDNTFLDTEDKPEFFLYMILLNRPFALEMFLDIFPKIRFFVCADGGANHLHDSFPNEEDR